MADEKTPEAGYELAYWGGGAKAFLGRAFGPLLIFYHAGKDPKRVDKADVNTAEAGCFAVPMVKFPDGTYVSQTPAICQKLGEELGLVPTEKGEIRKCVQVSQDVADVMSDLFNKAKRTSEEWQTARVQKWLAHFDNLISKSGKGWVVGSTLTYADYCLLTIVEALDLLKDGILSDHKNVTAWFETMKGQNGYKKYLENKVKFTDSMNRFPPAAEASA